MRYALPYADSQCSTARPTGSAAAEVDGEPLVVAQLLPHRVPASASTALPGVYELRNWVLEALAGRPVGQVGDGVAAVRRELTPPAGTWAGSARRSGRALMPPSGDWTIVSAHHWSPARAVLSAG